jgi:hypothetical protein
LNQLVAHWNLVIAAMIAAAVECHSHRRLAEFHFGSYDDFWDLPG